MVFGLRAKLIPMAVCTVAQESENFIYAQKRLAAYIGQQSKIDKNTDMFTVIKSVLLSIC